MDDVTNFNFTNVCWYCGAIYKSNRSTSKYCCKKHNSLYSQYGVAIKPSISKEGVVINFDPILECIYKEDLNKDLGLSASGYLMQTIRQEFEYSGPLPLGDEILVVGSYIIKKNSAISSDAYDIFYVKPFTLLTEEERMCSIIVEGKC